MDPLLILIQLERLIQFQIPKNYVSQFPNPIFQFLIDPWIQITRMDILPRIFDLEVKDSNEILLRNKVFDRNIN